MPTQRKRMVVTFNDDEWAKVQAMKQKLYSSSYSEVIRRAINAGFKSVMNDETRKAETAG